MFLALYAHLIMYFAHHEITTILWLNTTAFVYSLSQKPGRRASRKNSDRLMPWDAANNEVN